jgi:hypothetical protein
MLAALRQCRLARVAVLATVLAGFLLAFALAASPSLHERFHHGQSDHHGQHECLATLLAAGGFDDLLSVVAFVVESEAKKSQVFAPSDEGSLGSFYLACRFLDHAPPLLS